MPDMPNRLANETSPYLQQHAGNPVDWYPWGPEALARAKAEDKPILLSIGYSACHWCHVMAHESFEDAQIAALMNRDFVNVKVDREERPDIDQIYQAAHQMLARGAGGWPLTMFLAPDGAPFLGGAYFPKVARYGLARFAELLGQVKEIWRDKRTEISEQNQQVKIAFSRTLPAGGAHRSELGDAPVHSLLQNLRANFDARHGGFGRATKFPHPSDLELCLRKGETAIAHTTLTRMCEGGIYDQLGGGFCRYSVDQYWMIPHFEKMLYDNGPLLHLLADAWLATGDSLYARCAQETAAWMMREMQSPEGGYYSSLDADSEHEEGKFYVWNREEVRSLLTPEEFQEVAARYGLDQPPNFENKHWHLRIAAPLRNEDLLKPARGKLLAAYRALGFIRDHMWKDGRLLATAKDGRAHLSAYLDDYAFLAAALLELLQAGFTATDLEFAEQLAEVLLEQFEDPERGGFFFTARDHEKLLHRPKPGHDNATPSGNGVATLVLGRLAALTGEDRYARAAERGAVSQWAAELAREFLPGMLVVPADNGATGLPPFLDKPLRPEAVNGWLCRGVTCLAPISSLEELRSACK